MLAPVGVESKNEITRPSKKSITAVIAAAIITPLKLLWRRIAISAGKIIRLEISIAPIIRMPRVIVTAVRTDKSALKRPTGMPDAFEKFSSNVIEKIRL